MTPAVPRRAVDWPPLPDLDPTPADAVESMRDWGLLLNTLTALVAAILLVTGVLALAVVLAVFATLAVVTAAHWALSWVMTHSWLKGL